VKQSVYYFYDVLKLLVFDLDGTLADTRRDLAESVNHALIHRGKAALPLEKVMENVGNGAERLIANCLAASAGTAPSPVETREVLGVFLDHYKDHCLTHTQAYPGTAATLQRLRRGATGAARRMAVLTNKPGIPTLKVLEGLGLSGYFDLILGGDTAFGRKPEAEGLKHIMASLETLPADTAMLGDGVQDAGAARKAGAYFVGFLGGIAPHSALLAEKPDATFAAMNELPAAIAGLEARVFPVTETRA
jgi:phosphoglycolate phosphatase